MGSEQDGTGAPPLVGGYRLLGELGRDALGVLHLACPAGARDFPKWAVVRRVHAGLARDAALVHAFLASTRVALRVVHRNVATTFDFGPRDIPPWVAREHILGETLLDLISHATAPDLKDRVPWEVACTIVAEAAVGLAAIRARMTPDGPPAGFITGAITPNVVISYAGDVKVIDGCMPLIEGRPVVDSLALPYVPPGRPADSVPDGAQVFALGVALWELVAGRRLFHGSTDDETLRLVDACVVPPLRNINPAAAPVDEIVRRALGKADPFVGAVELERTLRGVVAASGTKVGRAEISQVMHLAFAQRMSAQKAALDDAWAVERVIQERGDPLPEEHSSEGDTTVTLGSTTRDDTGLTMIAVREPRAQRSGEGGFDDIPTIPRVTRPTAPSEPTWRTLTPPVGVPELPHDEAPSGEVTVVRDIASPEVPTRIHATPQISYVPESAPSDPEALTPEVPVQAIPTTAWLPGSVPPDLSPSLPYPPDLIVSGPPGPPSSPDDGDVTFLAAPARPVVLPPVEAPYSRGPLRAWPPPSAPARPPPAAPVASLLSPPANERRSLLLVALIGFLVALGVVLLVAQRGSSPPGRSPASPSAPAAIPTVAGGAAGGRPVSSAWAAAPPPPVPTASPDEPPRVAPPPRVMPAATPAHTGLLTVLCTPPCDRVLDGNRSLGSSPVFKAPVTAGVHRLRLRVDSPPAERAVTVTVPENDVIVVRENVSP